MLDSKKMSPYNLLYLILLVDRDIPKLRSALHDLAYFCHSYIPKIDDMDFEPHYRGPYSAQLSVMLVEMISCSFIDENTRPGPAHQRYHYLLSDAGKRLALAAKARHERECGQIVHVVGTCNSMTGLHPDRLSQAAKVHYISKEHNTGSVDEILEHAPEYGWQMEKTDVAAGIDLVKTLEDMAQTGRPASVPAH
ncbi:hypothetical protein CENSYa_2028 [Cenarchaeum symbiosum A]|uniref:Uncharacterized protein n=1 Tax=Cenarchaeum symbiosum (strain A) TaxID=414004 RepID=A0RZ64_CENSY|nr:hypothetical protein CENSYa_2028 [Cenarchaeum symbiosum A]